MIDFHLVFALDKAFQDAKCFKLEIVVSVGSFQLLIDDAVSLDPEGGILKDFSIDITANIFEELDDLDLIGVLGFTIGENSLRLLKESIDEGLKVNLDSGVDSSEWRRNGGAEEVVVLEGRVLKPV